MIFDHRTHTSNWIGSQPFSRPMSGSRCRYRANISESPTPSSSRHAFRAAEPRRTSLAVREPLRIASCVGWVIARRGGAIRSTLASLRWS